MKITDNSLCNIDFSQKADPKKVREYIKSLFDSCVDFVEIDNSSLKFLEGVNTSKSFIFRIESVNDFTVLKDKRFAFIVLPISMLPIAQKLSNYNVMIEIESNEESPQSLFPAIEKIHNAQCASFIRIMMDFGSNGCNLSGFIDEYYERFSLPLDICPLNTTLNGLDAAFAAYNSNTHMLTLSFGSPYVFTPLEAFTAYLVSTYDQLISCAFIPYLYVTAVKFSAISDSDNYGLKNLNDILKSEGEPVENIDIENMFKKHPKPAIKKNDEISSYPAAQSIFFRNAELEPDICRELSKIIDDACPELFNRILKEDDFES